jgi:Domain of unknown function (DUF4956)
MNEIVLNLLTDVVAIGIVSYAIYFRRYYRRDLLLAYIALNVGIFSVTALLAKSTAGVGLGLGLFGILSIIRLRSDSITQEEIAYYFVALALGLVAGLSANPRWVPPLLSTALVVVMYVVDHPRLTARAQRQTIILDRAYPDRALLKAALESLLDADVKHLVVERLDLVADTTMVDVRFKSRRRTVAPERPIEQLVVELVEAVERAERVERVELVELVAPVELVDVVDVVDVVEPVDERENARA